MSPAEPRLARAFVMACAPYENRQALLDDLREEFLQQSERHGRSWARRWYRRQAMTSMLPLIRRRSQAALRLLRPDLRGDNPVSTLLQDLRYSWRALRHNPTYTVVVVLVLALGIGANTTIFSLVNPFIFRPLPYAEPDRLVHMFGTDTNVSGFGWDMQRQSLATLSTWQRQADSFADLAGYWYGAVNMRRGTGDPERMSIGYVSWNLFTMLGVEPQLGRSFAASEGAPDAAGTLILSDSVWRSRFAGNTDIVGSSVSLDGREYVIVGVMPPGFNFPFGSVRMWTPITLDPAQAAYEDRFVLSLGRLAPGVEISSAAAELEAIVEGLRSEHPLEFEGRGVRAVPLRNALIFFYEQFRAMMLLFLMAVAFVLLIVCANVANLALSRATQRRREIAVRSAIGAERGRVLRQLLTESMVLALAAGALGVAIARPGIGALSAMIPGELWRVGEIEVDATALTYTLLISLATAVAFGLLPALQTTRLDLMDALKGGGGAGATRSSRRFARLLVAAQVAVATVLCGGALTMIGAVRDANSVDIGLDPDPVLTMQMHLPDGDYGERAAIRAFYDRLRERVGALPGVEAAALVGLLPLDFAEAGEAYMLPGAEGDDSQRPVQATLHRVSPGYFRTMGIRLQQGRAFDATDGPDAAPVVVVSEMLARRHWPEADPVGRTLLLGPISRQSAATVIGVVADSVGGFIFNGAREQLFVPQAQRTIRGNFLTVRSQGNPGAQVPAIRQAIRDLDPTLPVSNVRTMNEVVSASTAPLVIASQVLVAFGVFALLLAALGVYGVIAYAVAQRTREIGVRMALGARRSDVIRLVLRSASTLVLIGAMLGGVLTFLIGAGVEAAAGFPTESVLVPVAVVALLAAVALLASWLPARRATHIDPVVALQAD